MLKIWVAETEKKDFENSNILELVEQIAKEFVEKERVEDIKALYLFNEDGDLLEAASKDEIFLFSKEIENAYDFLMTNHDDEREHIRDLQENLI